MNMHQSGELEKVLEEADVLVPIELAEEPEKPKKSEKREATDASESK
jgi:hypothetical protein